MEFIEALQSPSKKLKHPTQKGFDEDIWRGHESEYMFDKHQSKAALSFGLHLFKTLGELRDWLEYLDQCKPKSLTEHSLKRHFVSLSNRHRKALSDLTKDRLESITNQESGEFMINHIFDLPGASIGPEEEKNGHLTLTDSAHQIVDNFKLVLQSLVVQKKQEPSVSSDSNTLEPLNELEWLYGQELVSALYDLLESYWHLVVYEENIPLYDRKKNIIFFNPINSELNIAKAVSLKRMDNYRASVTAITASLFKKIQSSIGYSFPIEVKKRKGVSYRPCDLKIKPKEFLVVHANTIHSIQDVHDAISLDICSKKPDEFGFSLNDVLQVFLSIRLFSLDKFHKFSSNTEYKNKGDLFRFNIEIDIQKFIKTISKCLKIDHRKVADIIEFLHYKSGNQFDLWSNPIIKKNGKKSFILITPFLDAVLTRNSEYWLRQLNISLKEKGEGFEDYVRSSIKNSLENSLISGGCFQVPDKILRFSGNFEEIDSLVIVGNCALVIEIKNIVAVDSPVSFATSAKRIKEGVKQVKRKCAFVEKNKAEIINRYEIDIKKGELNVIPVVLVSNFICAGCVVDGVSVTDLLIFQAFFDKKGRIPILSFDFERDSKHRVEVEVYDSLTNAEKNIDEYLRNPPQLRLLKNSLFCASYESGIEAIPGFKVALRCLDVNQNHDFETIIHTDFGFPVIVN
jgi:hypothetical protein